MDWDKITAELQKPLDKSHVRPAQKFGPKGDYIEAWHAQAEANRIFGFGGWSQEVVDCTCVHQGERPVGRDKKPGWGVTYTARVRVVVDNVAREDFGAGHGYDADLGLAHESAVKEAVSDAMKRALKSFGNPFGLALYDKNKVNVVDIQAEEAARVEKASRAKAFAATLAAEVDNATDPLKAAQCVMDKATAVARAWEYREARELVVEALGNHDVTMEIRDGSPVCIAADDPARLMAGG